MIVLLHHAAVLRFSAPSVSVFSVCVLKHMIHIVFPVVSLSLRSVTLSSRLPGGEETGLGSSDGKVGQRSQPSTGELLKRPGEMMSWTLFLFSSPPPPYVFFPPSLPPAAAEKPGSRRRAKALAELVMHITETHDTDDFIELK